MFHFRFRVLSVPVSPGCTPSVFVAHLGACAYNDCSPVFLPCLSVICWACNRDLASSKRPPDDTETYPEECGSEPPFASCAFLLTVMKKHFSVCDQTNHCILIFVMSKIGDFTRLSKVRFTTRTFNKTRDDINLKLFHEVCPLVLHNSLSKKNVVWRCLMSVHCCTTVCFCSKNEVPNLFKTPGSLFEFSDMLLKAFSTLCQMDTHYICPTPVRLRPTCAPLLQQQQ